MESGKKLDSKKPRLALIPPEALIQMGWAFTDGEQKYGTWNYTRGGLTSSRYISAAMRHLVAYMSGQDYDSESSSGKATHLGNALASIAMEIDRKKRYGDQYDDRCPYDNKDN